MSYIARCPECNAQQVVSDVEDAYDWQASHIALHHEVNAVVDRLIENEFTGIEAVA